MAAGVLSEGSVFAARYQVVRCIAQGGMGAVYEVVHLETERRRALKVMHAQFLQSDELRGRFRLEARVAANVESEHIVDVFDAGIDDATGMPFLVMELLRGEELGKRLRRVQRFPAAEVVQYLHQTALALDKTHRASIVHRDLKPDNLFLCERDEGPPRIKVLDFGIAKLVAEDSTQANATRSMGTPLYMSPEQFRNGGAVSAATDIFALGMIAYTLLVGVSYWFEESKSGGNVFAFAATAAGGPREPATARALRQGVTLPPTFDAWFAKVTAYPPAQRFPTASAAVQALAYALGVPRPGFESASAIQVPPVMSAAAAAYPSFQATPPGMMMPLGAIPTPSRPAAASGSLPTMQLGPMHTPIAAGVPAAPGGNRRTGLVAAAVASVALIAGSAILYAVLATTRSAKAAPELSAAPALMQPAAAPQPLATAPASPPAPEAVPAASPNVDTVPPPATAAPSAAASATRPLNSLAKRGSVRSPAPTTTSDMDLYGR